MAKGNYVDSNNHFICMGGQGLNQSFSKHNIKFGFKVYGIMLINPMKWSIGLAIQTFTQHQQQIITRR